MILKFFIRPAQYDRLDLLMINKQLSIFCCILIFFISMSLPRSSTASDLTIVPELELRVEYDDNLDFDEKDEIDDFAGNAIPRLTLDYKTELLDVALFGELDFLKYYDETDFDRTNQLYGFDGRYQVSSRWALAGNFEYRRDETIDSQLEETGQVTERNRVNTYDAGSGLFYQLTELSDVGFVFDYRKRDYSSADDTDFDRYTFSLPYIKKFGNQRDILTLTPSYSIFDSDEEDVTDYRFGLEWQRLLTETLTSEVEVGVRYTDIEDTNGRNDDNIGYFGELGLIKKGETFSSKIALSRDIRANTDGEIVEVNRIFLKFDKRMWERFGFRFNGSGYLSDTESSNAKDEKTRYFVLSPTLYYMLTEYHSIELAYKYQNKTEFDEPSNPMTERNRVWIGVVLKFPKKWN
jgi:hypothetical protein